MWQVLDNGNHYNNDKGGNLTKKKNDKGGKNLAVGFATNFQVQDMETPPNKLKDFSTLFFHTFIFMHYK